MKNNYGVFKRLLTRLSGGISARDIHGKFMVLFHEKSSRLIVYPHLKTKRQILTAVALFYNVDL